MAGSSFFSPPDFIEREPWEHGFAQIFARDIAPRLASLECRRGLLIALIAAVAVIVALLFLVDLTLGWVWATFVTLAAALLAAWFRRQEERLLLPAVCRQFAGLTVQVAPPGQTVSGLQPYWSLNLIARPTARHSPVLEVRELFTAERRGVALSVLAIALAARKGNRVERVFYGDLVKLSLPDLGPGNAYAAGRFDAGHLCDADMSAGSHDLRTPPIAQALAQFCDAFASPQALGAVSGNLLYIAVPFSKRARRTARLGLSQPVYRCESAIRAALAQLNAALRLTDAVAEACAQPAVPSARTEGPVAVLVPPPPLPQRQWSVVVIGVAGGVAIFLIFLAFYA
jgi:hypothetical protein